MFISNISCNNKGLFKLNDSIIKLELKVTKKQKYQIFYKTFMNNNKKRIKSVKINQVKKTINSDGSYYFQELNINYIEIIMSDYITNCYRMFYHSNSITKIDLSKFHTKQVQNMLSMFSGCSSLTSLNLLNFATSNVEMMDYMFYGCSSLTSLDLSMFVTSKV